MSRKHRIQRVVMAAERLGMEIVKLRQDAMLDGLLWDLSEAITELKEHDNRYLQEPHAGGKSVR